MASGGSKDTRFSAIETDPRFKLPRKKSIRGSVDDRFKSALETDKRFQDRASIDKYGRKKEKRDTKKELSRYYNFDDEEKEHDDEKKGEEDSEDDEEAEEKTTKLKDENKPIKKLTKPDLRKAMRGEAGLESSSSESESESDSDLDTEGEAEIEDEYEQIRQSNDAVPKGDVTKRIAVVNMDWDNITSTDLMSTFSSFIPANGRIVSVQIFPSEYGKKQMQAEETQGPASHLFGQNGEKSGKTNTEKDDVKSTPEVDDDQDYSSSKLRKYQLQRLQYYYAVVTCDKESTASIIYDECDGTEYESTANFFDLRFIPDEVDFSQDTCRDECYKLPANYQPTDFTTDALQHSKVKLTWDETPKDRMRTAQKAFQQSKKTNDEEALDDDVRAYLASDESDEEDDDLAAKYRALLSNSGNGEDESGSEDGVEITFNPVLEGKEAKLEIIEDKSSSKSQQAANEDDNLTTIERYRLKEKQRRLRRMEKQKAKKAEEAETGENKTVSKAELELLAMDDDLALFDAQAKPAEDLEKSGNNGKKKKALKLTKRAAKKKQQEEAESDFNTADPRFAALYEDPDFAIDSTLPQFKKTKGMDKIMQERRRRQQGAKDPKAKRQRSSQEGESIEQLAAKLRRKSGKL